MLFRSGNRVFGDGNVFDATGGTAGLGEINRLAFPEYILLTRFYFFYPGSEFLVVPYGNFRHIILVRLDRREIMFLAEFRSGGGFDELLENSLLVRYGMDHVLFGLPVNVVGKWFGKKRFDLHAW